MAPKRKIDPAPPPSRTPRRLLADSGIAVRMVLHGLPDDIGDFVIAAVVHFPHGVQDAPLDGLEAIFDRRYSPL